VDDVTAATLRFASGAVGTLAASCLLPRLYRAAVHTVSPGLALEVSDQELVVETGAERERHLPAVNPRVLVDREFLDAVQGRRERASGQDRRSGPGQGHDLLVQRLVAQRRLAIRGLSGAGRG